MKMLTETEARHELIKAILRLSNEWLSQVYSRLVDDSSIVVTPDGDPHVHSRVYQGGHYVTEYHERYSNDD